MASMAFLINKTPADLAVAGIGSASASSILTSRSDLPIQPPDAALRQPTDRSNSLSPRLRAHRSKVGDNAVQALHLALTTCRIPHFPLGRVQFLEFALDQLQVNGQGVQRITEFMRHTSR